MPGAYESAFSLLDQMQEDVESDTKEEKLCENFAIVSLSKEDKVRIRSQWSHPLILTTLVALLATNTYHNVSGNYGNLQVNLILWTWAMIIS